MGDRVQVLLYVADPDKAPGAVEDAYHQISRALYGTPGLIGNKLLRLVRDPRSFVVLSEWADLEAFRAWEDGAGHRPTTAALRPLQDVSRNETFHIYEVTASYPHDAAAPAPGSSASQAVRVSVGERRERE